MAVFIFFSLSESKRAPYILPLAPAVAILASGVFERLSADRLTAISRRLAVCGLAVIAMIFIAAGPAMMIYKSEIPPELMNLALILACVLGLVGIFIASGILFQRLPPLTSPISLLTGITAIYLVVVTLVFPAINPYKSERGFTDRLFDELKTYPDASVATYRFSDRHAGYVYYAQRNILSLKTSEELALFWRENPAAYLIVEAPVNEEMRNLLPNISQIYKRKIGSREAFLFTQNPARLVSSTRPEEFRK